MTTTTFDPSTAGARAAEILQRGIEDTEQLLIHEVTADCLAALGDTGEAVAAKLIELGCLSAPPIDYGEPNDPEPDEKDNPISNYLTGVCGARVAKLWGALVVVWATPDGAIEVSDEDVTTPEAVADFLEDFAHGDYPALVRH